MQIITPHIRASFPTIVRKERSIFLESIRAQEPSRIVFINNPGLRNLHWNVYVWEVPVKTVYLIDSLEAPMLDPLDSTFMVSFLNTVWPLTSWKS